jgi:putative acetyltransferase
VKTLFTPRLILRSWRLEDAADMYDYASTPTVGPAAGWGIHQSVLESEAVIRRFLQSDETWALVHRESGKVIGSVGLHRKTTLQGDTGRELGYVLSPDFEGRGLMTEACLEVLRFAFEDLAEPFVTVNHFLDNAKSRRVIEKCGFVYQGEIDYVTHDGFVRRSRHYRIDQTEFKQRRNP